MVLMLINMLYYYKTLIDYYYNAHAIIREASRYFPWPSSRFRGWKQFISLTEFKTQKQKQNKPEVQNDASQKDVLRTTKHNIAQ